ncbi:hypothetical protein L1887_48625 [Cichorium endivia]|nr:hypothetical protein L1887_48625 [Cichorium endivia]
MMRVVRRDRIGSPMRDSPSQCRCVAKLHHADSAFALLSPLLLVVVAVGHDHLAPARSEPHVDALQPLHGRYMHAIHVVALMTLDPTVWRDERALLSPARCCYCWGRPGLTALATISLDAVRLSDPQQCRHQPNAVQTGACAVRTRSVESRLELSSGNEARRSLTPLASTQQQWVQTTSPSSLPHCVYA